MHNIQLEAIPRINCAFDYGKSKPFNTNPVRSAINTHTNDFMISHNLPHAVDDKCYHHDGQHDTKYYNNDKNMLGLCFVDILLGTGKRKKCN